MKRKSLTKIIICLISAMLFAGCGKSKSSETELKDKLENAKENTAIAEDDDSQGEEKTEEIKEQETPDEPEEETEENEKPKSDFDFAGAFKEGLVYNNGNYFVRIKDKVYFRNISPESMDKGATFGEFLHTEFNSVSCPLISYDINTCEWEEIGTVAGTEKLYACPEGFFIGETDPDLFDASCTNLYDPATKETSLYCKGLPLGVSESGEILAVEEYGGQNIYSVLYKGGKEIARLGGENIFYEYVGFAGETLITILHTANEEYILCSADETGEVTELGTIGNLDTGHGQTEQFRFFDGHVYLCLGYYEGTGHFLSRWEVVKAKPGVKGSLEIAINGDDVPSTYEGEGPDPAVPIFFFDETGTIDCSEHIPYQAYMCYSL